MLAIRAGVPQHAPQFEVWPAGSPQAAAFLAFDAEQHNTSGHRLVLTGAASGRSGGDGAPAAAGSAPQAGGKRPREQRGSSSSGCAIVEAGAKRPRPQHGGDGAAAAAADPVQREQPLEQQQAGEQQQPEEEGQGQQQPEEEGQGQQQPEEEGEQQQQQQQEQQQQQRQQQQQQQRQQHEASLASEEQAEEPPPQQQQRQQQAACAAPGELAAARLALCQQLEPTGAAGGSGSPASAGAVRPLQRPRSSCGAVTAGAKHPCDRPGSDSAAAAAESNLQVSSERSLKPPGGSSSGSFAKRPSAKRQRQADGDVGATAAAAPAAAAFSAHAGQEEDHQQEAASTGDAKRLRLCDRPTAAASGAAAGGPPARSGIDVPGDDGMQQPAMQEAAPGRPAAAIPALVAPQVQPAVGPEHAASGGWAPGLVHATAQPGHHAASPAGTAGPAASACDVPTPVLECQPPGLDPAGEASSKRSSGGHGQAAGGRTGSTPTFPAPAQPAAGQQAAASGSAPGAPLPPAAQLPGVPGKAPAAPEQLQQVVLGQQAQLATLQQQLAHAHAVIQQQQQQAASLLGVQLACQAAARPAAGGFVVVPSQLPQWRPGAAALPTAAFAPVQQFMLVQRQQQQPPAPAEKAAKLQAEAPAPSQRRDRPARWLEHPAGSGLMATRVSRYAAEKRDLCIPGKRYQDHPILDSRAALC